MQHCDLWPPKGGLFWSGLTIPLLAALRKALQALKGHGFPAVP
jgi:hypothetical protein